MRLQHTHFCNLQQTPLFGGPSPTPHTMYILHALALKWFWSIYMINVFCLRDKVCSSMEKWEHIDHFILFAISKFNIPLESISKIESIFFVCVPRCSLFSRSKIHFWLITNAWRSWRANVFVECQLMLSDKCLKLSQGSCPSFRLCQMSSLVEEDNSSTGGDRTLVHCEGWPCHMGLQSGERKSVDVLIETL